MVQTTPLSQRERRERVCVWTTPSVDARRTNERKRQLQGSSLYFKLLLPSVFYHEIFCLYLFKWVAVTALEEDHFHVPLLLKPFDQSKTLRPKKIRSFEEDEQEEEELIRLNPEEDGDGCGADQSPVRGGESGLRHRIRLRPLERHTVLILQARAFWFAPDRARRNPTSRPRLSWRCYGPQRSQID